MRHDKRLGECGETRLKSATARAADGRDLKEYCGGTLYCALARVIYNMFKMYAQNLKKGHSTF